MKKNLTHSPLLHFEEESKKKEKTYEKRKIRLEFEKL
jgi:hypothetical protein